MAQNATPAGGDRCGDEDYCRAAPVNTDLLLALIVLGAIGTGVFCYCKKNPSKCRLPGGLRRLRKRTGAGLALEVQRQERSAYPAQPAYPATSSVDEVYPTTSLVDAAKSAMLIAAFGPLDGPVNDANAAAAAGTGQNAGVAAGGTGSGLPASVRRARQAIDTLRLAPERIGAGSFGTVHVGTWQPDGDSAQPPLRVAVKVMHTIRINQVQLDTFSRALQLELELKPHPNVVRIFCWACDATSAKLLLAMEFCEGGSLGAALEAGRTSAWPWHQKLQMARQIADGLAFLHSHTPPVVHRDLKPDNILLDARLSCKICDLGASRYLDDDTDMSGCVSTPLFSSPEQLRRRRYDASADVWAAGCVLICLLDDLRTPYLNEPVDGVLIRVASGETRPRLRQDSTTLHELVGACCAYEPSERLSAAHLAEMILRTIAASQLSQRF